MNETIKYLNLIGVLVLATLCVSQWSTNSQQEQMNHQLQLQTQEQAQKLATQEITLQQNQSDLTALRQRLDLSEQELTKTQAKLQLTDRDLNQQKQANLQYLAAIKQRDQVLAQQSEMLKAQAASIQKIQDQRNDAVNKFNELATKYNAIMASGTESANH